MTSPPLTDEEIGQLSDADLVAYGRKLGVDIPRPLVTLSDLQIRTKTKEVVRFRPNAVQRIWLDLIVPGWAADGYEMRGLRELILKARQFGFSTQTLALFYLDTVNHANTETVVIAHDGESTEKMFRAVHMFHEQLPAHKRPRTRTVSKRELVYEDLNSTFRVLTAGTKTSGRSATINNLLCSEAAHWDDPDVLTGLLQAVPRDGNIVLETTANGEGVLNIGPEGEEIVTGSQFHVDWIKAKGGKSAYKPRFFAWFQHEEYRTPTPPDFALVTEGADLSDLQRYGDEAEMMAVYGLDEEQVYWRRNKIDEPKMGAMFRQEYPANDQEAFRVGGLRFFDSWDEKVHVEEPFEIPAFWKWVAAYDWGYGAPRCMFLAAIDERQNVFVVDELYGAGLTNPQQARSVVDLFERRGISRTTPIYADNSMWAKKTQADGSQVPDVKAFWDEGLVMIQAGSNTQHAWNNVRAYLHNTRIAGPAARAKSVVVFETGIDGQGGCPNLIRTMPLMKRNPLAPEKLLEVYQGKPVEDHAPATFSYLLGYWMRPSVDPEAPPRIKPPDNRPLFMKRKTYSA